MKFQYFTASIRDLIDCNEEEVFSQERCVFPFLQALKEEIKHAILFNIWLVQVTDDHSLVFHGSTLQKSL